MKDKLTALLSIKNNLLFLLFVALQILVAASLIPAQTWTEDTFEDFAKGTLDASGQNIYVSRKGEIRTIHRFDINSDGFIDLLFNSTHNDYAFIPSTLAYIQEGREVATTELAVEGALKAEVEDLNHDGYQDIVFLPSPSGIQRSRRFVTIIWGGKDGWPSHRSNGILPVNGARDLVVSDINGDGWADIVTLNSAAWRPGQPAGNIIQIFWGGQQGYLLNRSMDIGIAGAIGLASGDFDSDGTGDCAVLSSAGKVHIIQGQKSELNAIDFDQTEIAIPGGSLRCITAGDCDGDGLVDLAVGSGAGAIHIVKGLPGRDWEDVTSVKGVDASHISVGEVDGDGYPDLVLSNFVQILASGGEMTGGSNLVGVHVNVLWGSDEGFFDERATKLKAPYTRATAIADLDSDGVMDIVTAVHQGEKYYAAESTIFYGKGSRQFETCDFSIPCEGAYHVAVVPSHGDRHAGVVISNSKGGNLREEVPILLYWGGPEGFNRNRKLEIPFRSGYEGTAADLNEDGYVDLIAVDEMHGGQSADQDPWHGVNIFWGGEDGFDLSNRRDVLNEEYVGTTNVADLNRDGYLDLVVGFFNRGDRKPTELVIYYGTANGFDKNHRHAIPCKGRSNSPMIADYDRDGWLDIAVNSYLDDKLRIFRGSLDGFSEGNQHIIDIPAIIDQETADLNNDGWLDIIACSYWDKVNRNSDTGCLLLWGGPEGFASWNAQWLPGLTPLGPVVADFDGDGYLDLFNPHYHGELRRELNPSYLYWGGG
ncbi:FG-GAP repeat domain-containing protein [Candidatus Latescibacterota bacterium]